MSAASVAELQALVGAALGLTLRAMERGHTRKARRLIEELQAAIAGDVLAPAPPPLSAGRYRGVDWDVVLPQAVRDGRTRKELAETFQVAAQSVRGACARRKIELPYSRPASAPQACAPTPAAPPMPPPIALPEPPVERPAPMATVKAVGLPRVAVPALLPTIGRKPVVDDWKAARIRTDLIAGRPLERIAQMRCVPLDLVRTEAAKFLNGERRHAAS